MKRKQWLLLTSRLLECNSVNTLTAQFMDTLQQELSLSDCIFLVPSVDGRRLVVSQYRTDKLLNIDNLTDWNVSDFSHPFAHVLQTNKHMVLDYERLAYWQDDVNFIHLVSGITKGTHLLIFPLKLDKNVSGLLVCAVSDISAMLQDMQWQQYCQVFMRHWQLLNVMQNQSGKSSFLADSLSEFEDNIKHQKNMKLLSAELLGEADNMLKLREDILRVTETELSVMIQGATGSGKEVVAKAIHEYSPRKNKSFVAINCAAIPEALLESELFGYEKGAFSGATARKQGLIAKADQGTLFLDEIGDMPLNLQSKLLRVLESGVFRALGGTAELYSNFRLVVATHVKLKQSVSEGEFRGDLYYRLCQFPIYIPSLNEHLEDVPLLANHFIKGFNYHHKHEITGIRYETLLKLKQHNYPGNVRELRNIIEYACALTKHHTELEVSVLPEFESTEVINSVCLIGVEDEYSEIEDLRLAVAEFERLVICNRLEKFKGDRSKAAMSLGLPKRTFAHKCLKLEVNE